MQYFDLKVGFSCNNDCVHCVVGEKRKVNDLTKEEIIKVIDAISPKEAILFTGGEPTIRDDFVSIIKHTKERGHFILLQTNGVALGKLSFAKEVKKYVDFVHIAVHSCQKDSHDKIVQAPGMYEKTVQGFKNIKKLNISHATQTVISKINADHLKETCDFIQSISPNCRMSVTFPHIMGNALFFGKKFIPKYSEIKPYIHSLILAHGPLLEIEAIPPCYLCPFQDMVNSVDERIFSNYKDNNAVAGLDVSVKDGIIENYEELMVNDKQKGKDCDRCLFNKRCVGVWKDYIDLYSDELDLYPVLF